MTGFPLTMSLVILMTKSAQEVKKNIKAGITDDYWKLVILIVEISCEIVTLLFLNQLEVRLIMVFLVLKMKT